MNYLAGVLAFFLAISLREAHNPAEMALFMLSGGLFGWWLRGLACGRSL